MNTQRITIDLPSDIFMSLNENELKQQIKYFLAINFYKYRKLTIGKAARLAGLTRFEFETLLSDNDISISSLTLNDVINDSKKL